MAAQRDAEDARHQAEAEQRKAMLSSKQSFQNAAARRAAERALVEEHERREKAQVEAAAAMREAEQAAAVAAAAEQSVKRIEEVLRERRGGPDGTGDWSSSEIKQAGRDTAARTEYERRKRAAYGAGPAATGSEPKELKFW